MINPKSVLNKQCDVLSSPIELLEFDTSSSTYEISDEVYENSDKISEWIHRAALKDVREIRMADDFAVVEVPKSIFLCHSLRSLALTNSFLTSIPDCFGGFAGMTTLNFYNAELNDKTVELMLELCPALENLIFSDCYGLKKLKICSNSLISLNLSDTEIETISANCPRLIRFTLIKVLGNTAEMEFYLPACSSLCTDVAQLEAFTTLKSLTKIIFLNLTSKSDVKILSEFPDLEQMCMGIPDFSAWRFSRSWYGAISQISATFSVERLKRVHLNMTEFYNPAPLITYLLGVAPAMKSLLVSRKKGFNGTNALQFVKWLLNLQREHTETKFSLSREALKEVRCLNCDL
ncbi:hypothetical protein SUGI_0346860 [Cryptomeria japonica]|nr:hypothetical protein SUGI_0346860 [Cryptomeria japonica]